MNTEVRDLSNLTYWSDFVSVVSPCEHMPSDDLVQLPSQFLDVSEVSFHKDYLQFGNLQLTFVLD